MIPALSRTITGIDQRSRSRSMNLLKTHTHNLRNVKVVPKYLLSS